MPITIVKKFKINHNKLHQPNLYGFSPIFRLMLFPDKVDGPLKYQFLVEIQGDHVVGALHPEELLVAEPRAARVRGAFLTPTVESRREAMSSTGQVTRGSSCLTSSTSLINW